MKKFEFYSQSRKSQQLYCRIFVEYFYEETLWQERPKDGAKMSSPESRTFIVFNI